MPYIDALGREQEDLEWDKMRSSPPNRKRVVIQTFPFSLFGADLLRVKKRVTLAFDLGRLSIALRLKR